jgi:hypothetical protein
VSIPLDFLLGAADHVSMSDTHRREYDRDTIENQEDRDPYCEGPGAYPVPCDVCEGSCTGACDAGAGTFPERFEADRLGITVSDLRNMEAGR